MSKELPAQGYPAAGARIVPQAYGAGKFGYILFLVLIPILIGWVGSRGVGFVIMLRSPSLHWWISGYAVVCGAVVIYLSAMKLDIRQDAISYTSLFHGTGLIFFSEISLAVLYTDPNRPNFNRWEDLGMWSELRLVGKLVITPKPETGKLPLKIPIDYFPDEAKEQVMYVLKPQEWDIRSMAVDITQR
jgi:hypothetical protein